MIRLKAMLASKKKEHLDAPVEKSPAKSESRRVVPKSFRTALDKLISTGVSSLDTTYLRALATHPTWEPRAAASTTAGIVSLQ